MSEICDKANSARTGTQKIVSPQESHINDKVGKAAANPGSSYKPSAKENY
jgi:hypothetical protein